MDAAQRPLVSEGAEASEILVFRSSGRAPGLCVPVQSIEEWTPVYLLLTRVLAAPPVFSRDGPLLEGQLIDLQMFGPELFRLSSQIGKLRDQVQRSLPPEVLVVALHTAVCGLNLTLTRSPG